MLANTNRRFRKTLCLLAIFVAASGAWLLLPTQHAKADDGGYPWSGASDVNVSQYEWGYTTCPANDSGCKVVTDKDANGTTYGLIDPYGYYLRNCTSFVAWKLDTVNGWNHGGSIGGAYAWKGWASANNYTVDQNPAVGSVAWFSYTHVAWVSALNSDGTVQIQEYNYDYHGHYNTRSIAKTSAWYLHFKDLTSSPTPPPAPSPQPSFIGTDTLGPNVRLGLNQALLSGNGRYMLVMQYDGNLVLYAPGPRVVWSTNTGGRNAAYATMQYDGNLVVYNTSNSPIWASNTTQAGSNLVMQSDGNLVIYNQGGGLVWATNTGGDYAGVYTGSDRLTANQRLYSGQYLRSPDKRNFLQLQGDGNLVLYAPGYKVLWASNTGGRGGSYVCMQYDGNFVLYNSGNSSLWATNTTQAGSSILVQSDGNLVIYNSSGSPVWATGTSS